MGKIKDELLDYMERHSISSVEELDGVSFGDIVEENRRNNG